MTPPKQPDTKLPEIAPSPAACLSPELLTIIFSLVAGSDDELYSSLDNVVLVSSGSYSAAEYVRSGFVRLNVSPEYASLTRTRLMRLGSSGMLAAIRKLAIKGHCEADYGRRYPYEMDGMRDLIAYIGELLLRMTALRELS